MTGQHSHTWSGDDWQAYCDLLFQERHKPASYVRVPDKDRGDFGIEGYTIDGTGCMYQCYATQAVTVRERYEAQRNKITRDLAKLARNAERLESLFGAHTMRIWILVVPEHDSKDLVAHARSKEQEVREKSLSFLDGHFVVAIQTDEVNFAVERAVIENAAAATITVAPEIQDEAQAEAVAALQTEQADQVGVMDAKLRKVVPKATVATARERLLRHAVDGDNVREHLRRNHPATLERLLVQHAIEERDILEERDFGQLHEGSVKDVRARYERRLHDRVPGLGDAQSSRLSHAAVAHWLMECPLDFPEVA